MHFLDEGKGPPVLCLHGNPSWSFLYRDLVRDLLPCHRVIVPDHLGCGLSEKPQDPSLYTLRKHVDRLEALLLHLRLGKLDLVFHDWGGAIGCALAARHPDWVRKAVVMNTAAFPTSRIPWSIAVCRWPLIGALLVRGMNAFVRAARFRTTVRPLPTEVQEGFAWPYACWRDRIAIHQFVRDIPMHPRHRSWDALIQAERGVRVLRERPTLLLWGLRDWCFSPAFLREWQERLPQAQTAAMDHAGHFVLEDSEGNGRAVISRFLS